MAVGIVGWCCLLSCVMGGTGWGIRCGVCGALSSHRTLRWVGEWLWWLWADVCGNGATVSDQYHQVHQPARMPKHKTRVASGANFKQNSSPLVSKVKKARSDDHMKFNISEACVHEKQQNTYFLWHRKLNKSLSRHWI